ncbi:MAG: amidase [Myxococcales bacterium]|nr:amidase [Myxococcales bacterium]
MRPPRLRGRALVAARTAAETPATAALLAGVLKKSLGLEKLGALSAEVRGALPVDMLVLRAKRERALPADDLPVAKHKVWPRTAASLAESLASSSVLAETLAARAHQAAKTLADNRVMNVLVCDDPERTRREAAESAARFKSGRPIGPLDGIPYLVKDELDVAGLPTRCGSLCESTEPRPADATVVARLRAAGAVFVGKTVMTEWGMSPLGQNPHFKMPHNAHHAERLPGGSSSGSAVGVALGVTPLAIGTDGGGSVRIPASLNGVFGIKPTSGRVSRAGDPSESTVVHVGPIAASPHDLALFLDAVASAPDARDPLTAHAEPPPPGGFGSRLRAGVKKLRIGVPESEWADAAPGVAHAGQQALAALEKEGAELVPVAMPVAKVAAPIGYLTIGCEALACHRGDWESRRHLFGDDLRLSFAVLDGISASDFLDAQRLRAALRREAASVLSGVDLIALPTTQTAAPELAVTDRGQAFADTAAIDAMCRFSFLGNLTGLPAGTAPVGLDDGLPVGLQLVGDAWDEAIVLGALAHLERIEIARVVRPKAALDLLG